MSASAASARLPRPQERSLTRRRRITAGRVLSYAAVTLVLVCYLFPLLYLVNTAVKSAAEFNSNPTGLARDLSFQNFLTAWNEGNFGSYTLNSVLYTVTSATLGTLVSLVVAFPVARGYVRHPRLWYGLFVVMLFLPNTIVTQFQLVLRLNLYNTELGYILVLAAGVGVGPLLIAGYLKSVPTELDEAVALDGGGYWRFLFRFIPPLIKPALATVFILQAIGVWNEIVLATVLLPSQSKAPVTLGLFAFQGTYSNQWGLLACGAMIVAAPLLVAYVFLQRYLVSGVIGGAVKG